MNLETLGVQEMNAKELTMIDGGGWFNNTLNDLGNAVGYAIGITVGSALVAVKIVAEKVVG